MNYGVIDDDGGNSSIGGSVQNSGSLTVSGSFDLVGLYEQTGAGASTTLENGAVLEASGGSNSYFLIDEGTFGGSGTVDGNVIVEGQATEVLGGASPGNLTVDGDYTQNKGSVVLDVSPNGSGGLDVSTITATGALDIQHAAIDVDFVDGANAETFINDGLLNLGTFFSGSETSFNSNTFTTIDGSVTVATFVADESMLDGVAIVDTAAPGGWQKRL